MILGLGQLLAPPTTQPAPGSGQGPEWGEAAPVGLLIILLMGGALFLLIKSMNRNLRRVPASFEPDAGSADDRPAEDTGFAAAESGPAASGPRPDPASTAVEAVADADLGPDPRDQPADGRVEVPDGVDPGAGSIQRGRSQAS
jgi:hypothetical protein